MRVGAEAGSHLGDEGTLYDDAEVWYIADAIPPGMSAAIAVLEHRWAIPLRAAIERAGGVPLTDRWLHPQDLLAVGEESGMGPKARAFRPERVDADGRRLCRRPSVSSARGMPAGVLASIGQEALPDQNPRLRDSPRRRPPPVGAGARPRGGH